MMRQLLWFIIEGANDVFSKLRTVKIDEICWHYDYAKKKKEKPKTYKSILLMPKKKKKSLCLK